MSAGIGDRLEDFALHESLVASAAAREKEMEEEQLEELEALVAIYGEALTKLQDKPLSFEVSIRPSEDEEDIHVEALLTVVLPVEYPNGLPELSVLPQRGLKEAQKAEMVQFACELAQENEGSQSIITIVEALREWLLERNIPEFSEHELMLQRVEAKQAEEIAAPPLVQEEKEEEEEEPEPTDHRGRRLKDFDTVVKEKLGPLRKHAHKEGDAWVFPHSVCKPSGSSSDEKSGTGTAAAAAAANDIDDKSEEKGEEDYELQEGPGAHERRRHLGPAARDAPMPTTGVAARASEAVDGVSGGHAVGRDTADRDNADSDHSENAAIGAIDDTLEANQSGLLGVDGSGLKGMHGRDCLLLEDVLLFLDVDSVGCTLLVCSLWAQMANDYTFGRLCSRAFAGMAEYWREEQVYRQFKAALQQPQTPQTPPMAPPMAPPTTTTTATAAAATTSEVRFCKGFF
jgi:hypothetical protein